MAPLSSHGRAAVLALLFAGCAREEEPHGAVSISANAAQTCVAAADGTVSCWGAGDSSTRRVTPTRIDGVEDAVEVATGSGHACARTRQGTVSCWGNDGQPLRVADLSDAVKISAGGDSTCARRAHGSVVCWGGNAYGKLGDGTLDDRNAPVRVQGMDDAVDVSVGDLHACAVRRDGTVWCWGRNVGGSLGTGSAVEPCGDGTCSAVPVQVAGMFDAIAVSAGLNFTCARRRSGTAACWGWNESGQVGDGTKTCRPTPVDVAGLTDVRYVYAGYLFACATTANGDGRCWGDVPKASNGVPLGTTTAMSGGSHHACALVVGGRVRCWGENEWGQLGDGTTTARTEPQAPIGF